MHFDIYLPVNLHLFDGEGGGGEGGAQGETQASAPASTRRGKSGENNVVYGKQPQADGQTQPPVAGEKQEGDVVTTSNTLEEKRKAYDELIRGEYKDFYTQDTQKMIDRRFKETKGLQDQVSKMQPIIDLLSQKYQVEGGDLAKLVQAIESDDVYWADAAEEAGMSIESFKQFRKMQQENKELLAREQARQGREAVDRQVQQWYQEAEAMKSDYANFDLAREMQNPEFLSMLQAKVPVRTAYEVVHLDQIKSAERQMTAQATERQITANVRARGARPAENGTTSRSGFTVKDDVRKLSKADRAEIVRQAQRGKTIEF